MTSPILFASVLSLAAAAPAAPDPGVAYVPKGVIVEAYASPTNGGINPLFIGIHLTGTMRAGSNACEANRYEVRFEDVREDDTLVVVATLVTKEAARGRMCPLYVDPQFKGLPFDHTVILAPDDAETALLANVGALDHDVVIATLPKPPDAEGADVGCPTEVLNCTMEYLPTACTYNGATYEGTNRCTATEAARAAAGTADGAFDADKLVCFATGGI